MKERKIVHVVCSFPPYAGGMGNSVYEIVKGMSKEKEAVVSVITPMYDNKKNISNLGADVLRLRPLFSFGNAAYLPQLLWKLKKYDIVHLHYPFYGAEEFVVLAKIMYGKKLRLFLHYHMDAAAPNLKGLIFWIYKKISLPLLMRYSEKISCASFNYVRSLDIEKYYSRYREKFVEIPFGVNLDRFKFVGNALKKSELKTIIFVGGLDEAHYFKGLDVLIEALVDIKVGFARLLVIGDGGLKKEYKKMVNDKGLNDRVEFLGKVDNNKLIEVYNRGDVFVLPSINKCEAFGLVLLEAMACGLPVIASRLPGVDSVFIDGEQGYYVEPGDSDELSRVIELVLTNEELANKMGVKARKLVEEKYDWQVVVNGFARLYGLHI